MPWVTHLKSVARVDGDALGDENTEGGRDACIGKRKHRGGQGHMHQVTHLKSVARADGDA